MKSSVIGKTIDDLRLEDDLLLSSEDIAFMRETRYRGTQHLEEYLDFLEEIGAFGKNKTQKSFYPDTFELRRKPEKASRNKEE